MKTGIRVVDAMTTKPVVAPSHLSVTECAKLMRKNRVGSVLVKESSDIIGILTEQDFVTKVVANAKTSSDLVVRDIMERDLVTISPGKDIYDALMTMKDNDIRKLPVEENDKIIGFLTMKDILKIEPQLFDLLLEKIDLREEGNKPVYSDRYEEGMCESCGNYTYRLRLDAGLKVCAECHSPN